MIRPTVVTPQHTGTLMYERYNIKQAKEKLSTSGDEAGGGSHAVKTRVLSRKFTVLIGMREHFKLSEADTQRRGFLCRTSQGHKTAK